MAKKKHICKPKKEKTTGAILESKIGDLSFHSKAVPMIAPGQKSRQRAPDYIVSEVVPGPKTITVTEKCKAKYGKGARKGKNIDYLPCDISLQFVGPSSADPMGIKPGAYLRICTKWGAAPQMVPVKDHQDAQRKAKRICGCVSKGDTSAKCAKKIAGAALPTLTRKSKSKAGENNCLQWSKNGKRCLRREKV